MYRKYLDRVNYLIISSKLQTIYWVFCELIKYDLCKSLKVLMLFDLIIEWGKGVHNFGPWYLKNYGDQGKTCLGYIRYVYCTGGRGGNFLTSPPLDEKN